MKTMRPQSYDAPAFPPAVTGSSPTNSTFATLPAQSIDAIAVHFPKPVLAGGSLLPAGNYTVSALKGSGESPVLRFQNETGEAVEVMATREGLLSDGVAISSEVVVAPDNGSGLRIEYVVMEGNAFQFLVSIPQFAN
jgi:hypothetical protein